jgi:hypothetical protein
MQAIVGHQQMERTTIKATNANDFPQPLKMALSTRDKQSKDTGELLRWFKD